MEENRRAVLCAEIRSLAVHLCRVMSLPENVEQLFVTHFCGIKCHLHHFRMPGFVCANIFVSRIRRLPAAVPYGGINHSRHALKRGLHAPETSRSESRYLCHSYHPLVQTLCHIPNTAFRCAGRCLRFTGAARAFFSALAPPPRWPLAFLAPAPYKDCSPKPLVRMPLWPRRFFSYLAVQIPNDIGSVRSSRHPASAAAQRLSDSPPPGRCPSFQCSPVPTN